jgi:hypothetical protein
VIPTLISKDRDARIMELRMLGHYIRPGTHHAGYRCVTDGHASYPLRETDDEAWDAAIEWLVIRRVRA